MFKNVKRKKLNFTELTDINFYNNSEWYLFIY